MMMQEVRLGGREFPLPALLSDVFYIGNYFYIMRCCVCCCLLYYLFSTVVAPVSGDMAIFHFWLCLFCYFKFRD